MENIILIKTVCTIAASLVTMAYTLWRFWKGKREAIRTPKPWLTALVLAVVSALVVLGIFSLWPQRITIKITKPSSGTTISRTGAPTNKDGYVLCPVRGTIDGHLSPRDKIYVLVKETGGDEWWVSGGALQRQDMVGNIWEQSRASLGHKDGTVKHYLICAIITEKLYVSAEKLQVVPEDVRADVTIAVELE